MGLFDSLMGKESGKKERGQHAERETEFAAEDGTSMRLREERMDVGKDRVDAGEVTLRKDVVEEEQTVHVPVAHDEVVIERRKLNGEASDETIGAGESVSIPLTAERVHVGKHTVETEEIKASKREVQENREVTDTLHKEIAHIDTEGEAVVTGMDEDKF